MFSAGSVSHPFLIQSVVNQYRLSTTDWSTSKDIEIIIRIMIQPTGLQTHPSKKSSDVTLTVNEKFTRKLSAGDTK
ncbi:hypothetical protein [Nitrosomonas sp.]|uniref:hypothetical protein n=1 Tax=Nitrosomonas sp. TaxID=42353 RepID=UPI0037C7AFF3